MFARTGTTLALFCPRCGKMELHDLSRFSLRREPRRQLVCHCGQWQGELLVLPRNQYLLRVPCLLCRRSHLVCLGARQMWQEGLHRLYCPAHMLEIGMVGRPDLLREQQRRQRQTWRRMQWEDGNEAVEDPQVLLEVLNVVHDLAARGDVCCSCAQPQIAAELLPAGVLLSCGACGARRLVPARDEDDLTRAAQLQHIALRSGAEPSGTESCATAFEYTSRRKADETVSGYGQCGRDSCGGGPGSCGWCHDQSVAGGQGRAGSGDGLAGNRNHRSGTDQWGGHRY